MKIRSQSSGETTRCIMGVGNRLDTLPGINFIGFATRIITTNIRNSWLWPNARGGEADPTWWQDQSR